MRLSIYSFAVMFLFSACNAHAAVDTDPETPVASKVDTAPCFAAVVAGDDDRIIAICGELIGNEKVMTADRLKAASARGAAYARKDQTDLAIADYDAALKIDLTRPDLLNARGELLRKKGDRPRAIRDFGAALKIDPQNEAVRANYKALAQEIERMGAKMSVQPPPKAPLK
ncbi:tetratricopeptide repeat protein [Tardiphaga alba]|uniref:Tetratricopeptide repeat protein n=1 Tax=Tardiphaga alba TaxID=340268 RepID=A0ABX8AJ03_9BRAD|nr:tetratricopeptide repeat protein [Tardiphaga alba]QUS41795.1 tetratricopeptide repeat protein [Tardiphaga alba]